MPPITIPDISLRHCQLSPEILRMREAYFAAAPEICTERASLVTRFSRDARLFGGRRISILDKATVYRKALETRRPVVWHRQAHYARGDRMETFEFEDRSPFAGSTTSKFKGVPLYPEFLALALWPELWTISRRSSNPYYISESEVEKLNSEAFPYWIDDSLVEVARKQGTSQEIQQLQLLQKFVFFLASKPNCISHTVPDFSRVVGEGLRAVREEAAERRASSDAPEKREFYEAVIEVLEGIVAYAKALAAQARSLAAGESDGEKKDELLEIARIYDRIPEQPASTLREGLTAIWLCWIAIHLENPNVGLSLGRLDQVLYQLYRQDIDSGRLTVEQAVDLMCHVWLKIGDHVPTVPGAGEHLFGGTGSNQAVTIGGVDENGCDAVNDLTYVILRAAELMMLRDPNLNARYHPAISSDRYLRRLCEANVSTRATPALHNDRAVIAALTATGHTDQQARDYAVIGCVEPGSNGRFYGHSGALLLNLPSVLELALFNGRHRHTGMDRLMSIETGDPTTFASYDEFKGAFEKQLRWLLDQAVAVNELMGRTHQEFYPTPILSAFFRGPMEKGKDLVQGGAEINASGAAIIGLADVADSLSAVEQHVFVERTCSFGELLDAIDANFDGRQSLHARLTDPSRTPKFGNEDPLADRNACWLLTTIDRLLAGRRNYRGGHYRAGYWTMTNHAGFGRLMRALPNGRRDGDNFASGITPVSGMTSELTKALNSVASLPAACVANGMALNLKYTPEGDGTEMIGNFAASVKGYFDDLDGERDGGMEVQFNVHSHNSLLDAVRRPDPEFLVRVSGYTAYFKDLNPQMQKEIIDRTEYQLSTGKALRYPPYQLPRRES